jgi:hypothetical protein
MTNLLQATSSGAGTSSSKGTFWRRFIEVEGVVEEVTSSGLSYWF